MTSGEKRPDGKPEDAFEERRKNFRVTCPFTIEIAIGERLKDASWIRARVLDLSLGGLRVSLDIDDKAAKDLRGMACSVRFHLGAKRKVLPGRFVGVYLRNPESTPEEEKRKPLEAGIRFEGLSVDDQFILVDLFGKNRTPLFL